MGFSTGGSMGFGLFLIKKMMDVYGWTIQAIELGKSAKFVITIPKLNKSEKENFQTSKCNTWKKLVSSKCQSGLPIVL
jgi:hypothetical protein